MDAVKYLKEAIRMCKSIKSCADCPLHELGFTGYPCRIADDCEELLNPDKCVEIIEKWSEAHLAKTRQSKFLEMYPNAQLDDNGIISICPLYIEPHTKDQLCPETFCGECRKKYWLAEVE